MVIVLISPEYLKALYCSCKIYLILFCIFLMHIKANNIAMKVKNAANITK